MVQLLSSVRQPAQVMSDYVSTHTYTLPPSADPARAALERDDGPVGH